MFAGKKSAQIREILISESAWEEMTCLFAPSLTIHIVQMFHLLSQVFYNLKKFLMMDMLGVGDAININTNKNIRQVC